MSVGNDEALARYKQYIQARGMSRYTVQSKTSVLGLLATFCGAAGVELLDASPHLIRDWLTSLFEVRARDTVKDYFKLSRVFYKWAISEGLAAANPFDGLETPTAPLKPIEPYSPAEMRALLAASDAYERMFILLLVSTGLRGSELTSLRVDDVDWESGEIRVWNGKGNKERIIVVRPDALAALHAYVEEKKRRHGYIWPAHGRLGYMGESTLYHVIRRLGQRVGVRHCTIHRFRNTFACRFLESGASVGDLAIVLGHSNITMSLHYASYTATGRALAAQRRFNGLNHDEGDDNELRSAV